ncbi:MAG TPA: HEAT repeat domain-containing protein [bacterium]|nr:HEAT repeat domain-containing protein [bacterium]
MSSAAYRRAAGLSPLAAHTPMQTAFGQIGMLGGIMIGHELETGVGLRERVDGATTLLDSLAMLLQFNVAGRIVHQGLGSRYAAWQRELHWRSEKLDPRPALDGPQGGATFGQPALALAGPAAFEAAKPKFDLKIFDRLLAKSSQDDFGQGSGGSNRRSPYRSGGGLRHFLADHQITAYKTVAFESNGNIREIELMQAQTLWHWEIPKGARLTQEKESGAGEWLVVVMPENGVLTVGNEKITGSNRFHFSAEGKLMAVELAEAAPGFFNEMKYELIGGRHQLIQGIFFFRGDKVYFDEGGRVDKAWFSVDKRYGGVLYPQGTTVSYDQAGKLSGILQKAPEKIGPKEATIDDLTPAELKDALSRGSRWEPVAVAEKLAKSGHSEGFSFLRERIQKPGLKRKLATFSDALLGSLVTKHSSFPLAELLFWDRERAAKALGRLGAKEDIDLFRAWLEGSNPDQRALAKTALAAHDEVSKSSSAGPTGIPSGEQ